MSMPQAFGQRTLSPAGGSDGESAALSYSNISSSLSLTTLAASRSLSWGRGWLAFSALGSNSISLPNPRESTAKSEDLGGGGEELLQLDLQGFSVARVDFAHYSGR